MKKSKKRYTKTSHVGIRFCTWTKKYEAYKTIKGKRYSSTFDQVRDAIHWRNTYVPGSCTENQDIANQDTAMLLQNPMMLLNQNVAKQLMNPLMQQMMESMNMSTSSVSTEKLLGVALQEYVDKHIMNLSHSSQQTKVGVLDFAKELSEIPMAQVTSNVIFQHVSRQKEIALIMSPNRYSFDTELKTLKAFFNWYRQKYDYKFVNPVMPIHFEEGQVREKKIKEKKLTPTEIKKLFKAFREMDIFWYEFALAHFYFAGRVQEPAGLQDYSVDFETGFAKIKDVLIWDRETKKVVELKGIPKNGEIRDCFMTPELRAIFKRRIEELPRGCHFVFHIKGKPLKYREIQLAYERALRRAGLFPKYSGTQFMRHSMATITRKVMGSVDAVMSVTGHKDVKVAGHYGAVDADNELNKESLMKVNEFLREDL